MNLTPIRPENEKQKPQARASYYHRSRQFVTWVNELGFERTFLGHFVNQIDSRLNLRWLTGLFLYCLLISFVIFWEIDTLPNYPYQEGELAPFDIKSPFSFEVIDAEQTENRKTEAMENIPAVFDFDADYYTKLNGRIRAAFRSVSEEWNSLPGTSEVRLKRISGRRGQFEKELGNVPVDPEIFRWLAKKEFDPKIKDQLIRSFATKFNRKIVEDLAQLQDFGQNRVILVLLDGETKSKEILADVDTLTDVTEVKLELSRQLCRAEKVEKECLIYSRFAQSLVRPNLTLNKQEIESRRKQAQGSVKPFFVQVKKGQLIINKGSPIQHIQLAMIDELKRVEKTRHKDFLALISAVMLMILILSILAFFRTMKKTFEVPKRDLLALGSVILVLSVIAKFAYYVSLAAISDKFPTVPLAFYKYAIPVSSGAMIVSLLLPSMEIIWFFSIFFSVVLGFIMEKDFIYSLIVLITSILAARGVVGCKKRDELYYAGIKAGFVSGVLIVIATLLQNPSTEISIHELAWTGFAGIIHGILASFVTLTLVPMWESIFVYTTDLKLLELSNLNHPLLKEMLLKAPGSYHHSLIVGSMCEAAAEAIGANPLLAKVCAYYHDIGKTGYARYFIENQRPGENKHDLINPGMSKTILVAHVKDGVELALKYKLGRQIIDVIEQHHGTTLISFFYHKAKESENVEMHETTEDEYRYPGPKPQFKEAALCMLADSVEAAARSLDEPTPARLTNIVRNIVQKKFLDGQLDECDLSLKNLTNMEDAFSKILLGIYHQRIDYPTGKPESKGTLKKNNQTTVL